MHFAAQSTVLLKAESMADKVEWINKLRNVAQAKGGQAIGEPSFPMRQSLSDGSLVSNYFTCLFSFM
jgi:dynamin GTPase